MSQLHLVHEEEILEIMLNNICDLHSRKAKLESYGNAPNTVLALTEILETRVRQFQKAREKLLAQGVDVE